MVGWPCSGCHQVQRRRANNCISIRIVISVTWIHFCSLTFFRLQRSKIDWWCSLNSPTAHYPVVQVFVFILREGIPSLWLKYIRHWCTYDEEMIITAIYTKFGTRFSRYETSCDLQYPDMWRFGYENSMCPKTYNSLWLFTYRANDYSFCFELHNFTFHVETCGGRSLFNRPYSACSRGTKSKRQPGWSSW